MKKIIITALSVAVLAGGYSACSPSEAEVKDDGKAVVKGSANEGKADNSTESAPAADEIELGDTVTVGAWDVKVTEVDKNANDVVARANMFNEKPKGQYVMVTYEATYHGKERIGDPLMDLTWTMTGPDSQVHDSTYVVDPSDKGNGWPATARAGGTLKDIVTFDVPANQINGSLVSVEDLWAEEWADFPLA